MSIETLIFGAGERRKLRPSEPNRAAWRPGRLGSLRQVVDLQRATFEGALLAVQDARSCGADRQERARCASALANLGKSWNTLRDAKRAILGGPLPSPLRPESDPVQLAKQSKRARKRLRSGAADVYGGVPRPVLSETPDEDADGGSEPTEAPDG
jgi:hypothetical protein